jgi:hypothetical protein
MQANSGHKVTDGIYHKKLHCANLLLMVIHDKFMLFHIPLFAKNRSFDKEYKFFSSLNWLGRTF